MTDGFIFQEQLEIERHLANLDRVLRLESELSSFRETDDPVVEGIYDARLSAVVGESVVLAAGGKKGLVGKIKSTASRIIQAIWQSIKNLWAKITGKGREKKIDKTLNEVKASSPAPKPVEIEVNIPSFTNQQNNALYAPKEITSILLDNNKYFIRAFDLFSNTMEKAKADKEPARAAIDDIAKNALPWHIINDDGFFLGGITQSSALMIESKKVISERGIGTFRTIDTRSKKTASIMVYEVTTDLLNDLGKACKDTYSTVHELSKKANNLEGLLQDDSFDGNVVATGLKFLTELTVFNFRMVVDAEEVLTKAAKGLQSPAKKQES